MAKMKCWLESSATPEERATLQALRGDQRDEYMRRFLVYQIREKGSAQSVRVVQDAQQESRQV